MIQYSVVRIAWWELKSWLQRIWVPYKSKMLYKSKREVQLHKHFYQFLLAKSLIKSTIRRVNIPSIVEDALTFLPLVFFFIGLSGHLKITHLRCFFLISNKDITILHWALLFDLSSSWIKWFQVYEQFFLLSLFDVRKKQL